MKHWKKTAAVCLLVCVYTGSMLAIRHRAVQPDTQLDQTVDSKRYAGDPVHLIRIQQVIDKLKKESTEDSEAQLAAPDEFDYPDFHPLATNAQVQLHKMFSNRRVAKLLWAYQSLPDEERRKKANALFAACLQRHERTCQIIFRSWIDPTAPKNTQSIHSSLLAICASLTIISDCCPPADLIDSLNGLSDLQTRLKAAPNGGQVPPLEIVKFVVARAELDNVFVASVVAHAIEKNFAPSSPQREQLARLTASIPKANIVLVPYDSGMTEFDFPCTHEGVPVDKSKGSQFFTVYLINQDSTPERERSPEKQREIISSLKSTIQH